MLLEHQPGQAVASRALLEAALDAIPAAAFVLAGSSIAYANATGRALYDHHRAAVVDQIRESLRAAGARGPYAITPVEALGAPGLALAVLRADRTTELVARVSGFSKRFALTRRQAEVLSLLARGYGNKTIGERIGVAESIVEEHVTLLLQKTGADSRAAVVAMLWMSS
jgi:DNA-binding NarL/FixJ family response regulator